MRTVVVSDMHLGAGFDGDLLRRPEPREILLDELRGADQVVLLGDVLELRDRPLGEVLEIARPFFEDLGAALGGGRVVIVPGNHDHQLIGTWLERRRMQRAPLGLEQEAKPDAPAARWITRRMRGPELALAYPGLWVRPGVYCTHGHYLDPHVTVPTFERLGLAAIERIAGRLPDGLRTPDDYESVQAPLYGFLYALAQGGRRPRRGLGENASARMWEAVHGRNGRSPGIRGRLLGSVVLPGAVALANRLGLGPLRWDISMPEIEEAGVRAMRELVGRLGIEAEHVVFGHTHRRGPLGGEPGWSSPGGVRLLNSGSWLYAPGIMREPARESPFWPGTVVVIEDGRPPELRHLLDGFAKAELRALLRAPPAAPRVD